MQVPVRSTSQSHPLGADFITLTITTLVLIHQRKDQSQFLDEAFVVFGFEFRRLRCARDNNGISAQQGVQSPCRCFDYTELIFHLLFCEHGAGAQECPLQDTFAWC